MDKINLTALCDGDLNILLLDVRREMKRREEVAAEDKNMEVVRTAFENGSLVDRLMEQVCQYWHDEFIEAFDAFLRSKLPAKFHATIGKLVDDAGSLSNDRDEIENGKCGWREEERYEKACTKLQTQLTRLVARIPK